MTFIRVVYQRTIRTKIECNNRLQLDFFFLKNTTRKELISEDSDLLQDPTQKNQQIRDIQKAETSTEYLCPKLLCSFSYMSLRKLPTLLILFNEYEQHIASKILSIKFS